MLHREKVAKYTSKQHFELNLSLFFDAASRKMAELMLFKNFRRGRGAEQWAATVWSCRNFACFRVNFDKVLHVQ